MSDSETLWREACWTFLWACFHGRPKDVIAKLGSEIAPMDDELHERAPATRQSSVNGVRSNGKHTAIESAPYTRETVSVIRSMAQTHVVADIAVTLGWSVDRVQRVAANYCIELRGVQIVRDPIDDNPPLTSRTAGVIEKRAKPPPPEIDLPTTTNDAALDRVIEKLSPSLVEVTCVLSSTQEITSERLGDRLGIGRPAALARVRKLKTRLRGTPYRITAAKGPGNGYRLVRIADGESSP